MHRAELLYGLFDRARGEVGVDHTSSDHHHALCRQGFHGSFQHIAVQIECHHRATQFDHKF